MAKMIRVFSERETSVLEKRLGLALPSSHRKRLWSVLDQFNFAFEANGIFPEDGIEIEVTDVVTEVCEDLEHIYGHEKTPPVSFRGEGGYLDLELFLQEGSPTQVLDALELFYCYLGETHKLEFQRAVNRVFEEESSDWRMKDGQFCPLVSAVPIIRTDNSSEKPPSQALGQALYEKGLERFLQAQKELEAETYNLAIEGAAESFELVLRSLLRHETGRPNAFNDELTENGLTPELRNSAGLAFGERMLDTLSFLRSTLGEEEGEIQSPAARAYAELAVNLASSFMFFAAELIFSGRPLERESRGDQGLKREGVA